MRAVRVALVALCWISQNDMTLSFTTSPYRHNYKHTLSLSPQWIHGTSPPRISSGRALLKQQPATRSASSTALAFSTFLAGNGGWLGSSYMLLLALQYAGQPLLAKKYAPKTIVKGSFVLVQDLSRVVTSAALLWATGSWGAATEGWSWSICIWSAGCPAILYMLQNYCALQAYQNLSPITFNVLNQTKTLSAAVCCFFLLGQRQSIPQVFSLVLLLVSALVMESIIPFCIPFSSRLKDDKNTNNNIVQEEMTQQSKQQQDLERRTHWISGVIPVLAASLLSGMAGAFTQQSLQVFCRNSLLFSMELGLISAFFNVCNLLVPWSPDGKKCRQKGLSAGWTWATLIPILTNAVGGILVGLVTKHAGSVRKGFALIQGMFLSGLLQNYCSQEDRQVTTSQWMGGFLAALSFTIYAMFPLRS